MPVLTDPKQSDEIPHRRIIQLPGTVRANKLSGSRASRTANLSFEIGVVLLAGEVDNRGASVGFAARHGFAFVVAVLASHRMIYTRWMARSVTQIRGCSLN